MDVRSSLPEGVERLDDIDKLTDVIARLENELSAWEAGEQRASGAATAAALAATATGSAAAAAAASRPGLADAWSPGGLPGQSALRGPAAVTTAATLLGSASGDEPLPPLAPRPASPHNCVSGDDEDEDEFEE
eukprot:12505894-Heterocapsa_arctica.AAC.1